MVFSQTADISIRSGTIGLLMYFTKRYQSVNPAPNRMRKIALQECIVILTDELLEKLDLIASSSEPIPGNHLLDTGNAVMFWASILNLNINSPTVERGLYFTAKTILMFS